ncbi:ABC transporter permease [Aliikangiella coralliicola]|uniref:Iron ABC transporter permease n=1 Tax=Aliikangiella coralliicola TaxID=2592383 RepID=A0A545UB18_9GAMM|nr:iron ABC transporter permease [Aliikangiella coralliicola]TQV86647.1 iron ABC transporter permease [Aliikangiella coralliicola]
MPRNDAISQSSNTPSFSVNIQYWKVGAIGLALFFSIPLLTTFFSIFIPNGEVWRHLYDTVLMEYLGNSLLLMLGVGVLSLLMGVSSAWLITMCQFPGSRVFSWLLLLPMAMPAYIIAYTYTGILDVSGPLQEWIRTSFEVGFGDYWFPDIRSLGGATVLLSLVLYPYIYLLTRAAFIEQSVCVLEVSRTLGCNAYRMFFKVALPLARPAILVGLSLVLMETLADYGTVQYFGVATFTTGIFRTWFGLGNNVAAAQLSAFMLLFVILLVYLERRSRKQSQYYHTSSKYSQINPIKLKGAGAALACSLCGTLVLLGFIIPVYFLISWAVATFSSVIDEEFLLLIWHSFSLALTTAIIALILAMFFIYGKRRYSGPLMNNATRFVAMGYALPGTIIAVGVMLPFAWFDNTLDAWLREEFEISSGLLLSGGLFILVIAYLVRFLAVSVNGVDAALAKVKPSMDEAGRTMGLKDAGIVRKIHMPMIKGSLLTAALLVFVDVLKELPATLILRPFNYNTLAIRTYELANEERLADAATPALAIVLVGIIPVILLSLSIRKSRPGYNARS